MSQSNLGLIMVKIRILGEKVLNPVPVLSPFRQARVVARHGEHPFVVRHAGNPACHSEGVVTLRQASNRARCELATTSCDVTECHVFLVCDLFRTRP